MVEGDIDTMEFVTFEQVTVNTRNGPVTRRVEVPLRPLDLEQDMSTSQPGPPEGQTIVQDHIAGIDSDVGMNMIVAEEPVMPKPTQKNKVLDVLY